MILTLLIAMVPVIELRGAIPFGVAHGLAPLLSAGLAIIGNLIPIPFLLLLVPKVFDFLRNKKLTKKMITWLEAKADKNKKTVDKYGWLGLIILVAIPLPGTGAWTGALVASCFKMKFRPSMLSIITGVLIAGAIVLGVTYGISKLL
ncbi:small multi-drug export protein [Candidatus Saccharibacteria bacterium]|nr:small multi-drug export protein [Candidatus Saccharibacteria bacterium]